MVRGTSRSIKAGRRMLQMLDKIRQRWQGVHQNWEVQQNWKNWIVIANACFLENVTIKVPNFGPEKSQFCSQVTYFTLLARCQAIVPNSKYWIGSTGHINNHFRQKSPRAIFAIVIFSNAWSFVEACILKMALCCLRVEVHSNNSH